MKLLLTYDTQSTKMISDQISAFISNNRNIDEWSLLFNGAYFLKSNVSFDAVFESMAQFFRFHRFVLALIELDDQEHLNGTLSQDIWAWFNLEDEEESSNLISTMASK